MANTHKFMLFILAASLSNSVRAVVLPPAHSEQNAVASVFRGESVRNFARNDSVSAEITIPDFIARSGSNSRIGGTINANANSTVETRSPFVAGSAAAGSIIFYHFSIVGPDFINIPIYLDRKSSFSGNTEGWSQFEIQDQDGRLKFLDTQFFCREGQICRQSETRRQQFSVTLQSNTIYRAALLASSSTPTRSVDGNSSLASFVFTSLDSLKLRSDITSESDIDGFDSENEQYRLVFSSGISNMPISTIPEPLSWCYFITGLGISGCILRNRNFRIA
jgi:hypothetical protein